LSAAAPSAEIDVEAQCRQHGYAEIVRRWEDAVPQADFVSLHVPNVPSTQHLVNAERLAQMQPHAWLVNTARGAIVDEVALYNALAASQIGGAALDVFEHEPYRPVHPDKDLRTLPNVIMTPHVASATQDACARMAARALRNIQLAERGAYEQMDLVNPEVLKR
jgi:phosphoglycerate dehydrogenase-like enzyme